MHWKSSWEKNEDSSVLAAQKSRSKCSGKHIMPIALLQFTLLRSTTFGLTRFQSTQIIPHSMS